MADELLIAVFSPDEQNLSPMTNAMVSTAMEIIHTRGNCEQKFGFPKAIDIGISAGKASVGLIGKDGFRKATVVGEAPDQARRMQMGGKFLRQHKGQADRIVFEDRVLLLISVPLDVKQLEVSTNELASVIDQKIFYIEPRLDKLHDEHVKVR